LVSTKYNIRGISLGTLRTFWIYTWLFFDLPYLYFRIKWIKF